MNKSITILLALATLIFLSGCTNNQDVERIKQQNDLLQSQLQENQENLNFQKNLKCQERWDKLKVQYNNVFSAYYNEIAGTCYVKYYDNNQMLAESSMEDFWPTLTISVTQLQQSIPKLYWGVTYQEVINILNNFQQPALKGLIIKLLLAWDVKSMQIIVWMKEWDNIPIISRADWYFWQYTLNYLKTAATWLPK